VECGIGKAQAVGKERRRQKVRKTQAVKYGIGKAQAVGKERRRQWDHFLRQMRDGMNLAIGRKMHQRAARHAPVF